MQTERVDLKAGKSVRFDLVSNSGAGKKGASVTAEYTLTSLKLLFYAYDGDIISYGKAYNEPLWKGDTVEMFLTLGRDDRYLELEVNPDGITYAALVENEGDGRFRLEFLDETPFEATAERVEDGYVSRWNVSVERLKKLGFDPENAKFNLYMQDYCADGLKLYALNPTLKDSFHVVSAFIPLKLSD